MVKMPFIAKINLITLLLHTHLYVIYAFCSNCGSLFRFHLKNNYCVLTFGVEDYL